MKRRISILLALVMVLSVFSGFSAFAEEAFNRANAEDVAKYLESKQLLRGYKDGGLGLEDKLLRQDAVVMLTRLYGEEANASAHEVTEAVEKFEDVNDRYYKPILSWAVAEGLFQGHSEVKFGFGENLTAGQYATVLLRALGYSEEVNADWTKAFDVAKDAKLSLTDNVQAKFDEEILRGEMAIMTFNALESRVKGEDKTLAEKLGVELPNVKPATLTWEVHNTNNLKEVEIEFSNIDLIEKKEELRDTGSYFISGQPVKFVEIDGNTVRLTLEGTLRGGNEYTLVLRFSDKNLNATSKKFRAGDNAYPVVESVESLGEYGLRINLSEPVIEENRNFASISIDGKRVYLRSKVYGRTVIAEPYRGSFGKDGDKIDVRIAGLEDFAGFKSLPQDFNVEIKKDEEAPKIVGSTYKGQYVYVEFDKPVLPGSVQKHTSSRNLGNALMTYRNFNFYAEEAKLVDKNIARYKFQRQIAKGDEVEIRGVQNFSQVTMEVTKTTPVVAIGQYTPEILNKKASYLLEADGEKGALAKGIDTITFEFDRDIDKDQFGEDGTNVADFFKVYKETGRKWGEDPIANAVEKVTFPSSYQVTVHFNDDKLNIQNDNFGFEYSIEIEGIKDKAGIRMQTDYVYFEIVQRPEAFVKTSAKVDARGEETVVTFEFNKVLDLYTAENADNYSIKDAKGLEASLRNVTISPRVLSGEKTLEVKINKKQSDLEGFYLYIESAFQSIDERKLSTADRRVYLGENEALVNKRNEAVNEVNGLADLTATEKAAFVEEIKKAADAAAVDAVIEKATEKAETNKLDKVDKENLAKAVELVNAYNAPLGELENDELATVKKAAKDAIVKLVNTDNNLDLTVVVKGVGLVTDAEGNKSINITVDLSSTRDGSIKADTITKTLAYTVKAAEPAPDAGQDTPPETGTTEPGN